MVVIIIIIRSKQNSKDFSKQMKMKKTTTRIYRTQKNLLRVSLESLNAHQKRTKVSFNEQTSQLEKLGK